MRTLLLIPAVTAVLGLACGSDSERPTPEGGGAAARPGQASAASDVAALSARAVPTGCDLMMRAEIERIAGPLDGEPKPEDNGCWYYVATDTTTAEWQQLRAGAERARAAGMDARAIELYHPTRAGLYVEADVRGGGQAQTQRGEANAPEVGPAAATPAGWDEVGQSPRETAFHGRAGFVWITVRQQLLHLSPDSLLAIANLVRGRIPEGPIAHPAAARSQPLPGQDPCSVLGRDEAEAVLGQLVVAPFRTRERTPLADPSGRSCAYLTTGHRVLVLTPIWQYGRSELDAARMVGGLVRQEADLPGIEGDTLEGPWDDAVVDLSGELLLLKGGQALGIRYQMSSTDAAGAIRLAEPALQRLAAGR